MSWEEKIKNAMFIGEKLVWKYKIKIEPVGQNYDYWMDEVIYFSDQRIIWDVNTKHPESIPYNKIVSIRKDTVGSGGVAAIKSMVKGGGVIYVDAQDISIGFQFPNTDSMEYCDWLLKEARSGKELKKAEDVPDISGERDPNAPPPSPKQGGGCFIATATFDSPYRFEVAILRDFRDQVLSKYSMGRTFITYYYKYSPSVAKIISGSKSLKTFTKIILKPLIKIASKYI